MALHWCGHRKDLKPHLMLNQSLEGKGEGRREGKELLQIFSLLSTASSRICAQYSPSFPGLSHWHHLLPPSWMSFLGSFSPYFGESPAGAAVSSSQPDTSTLQEGSKLQMKTFISFLRVTNVAAKPNSQTKEQELEFSWNGE